MIQHYAFIHHNLLLIGHFWEGLSGDEQNTDTIFFQQTNSTRIKIKNLSVAAFSIDMRPNGHRT